GAQVNALCVARARFHTLGEAHLEKVAGRILAVGNQQFQDLHLDVIYNLLGGALRELAHHSARRADDTLGDFLENYRMEFLVGLRAMADEMRQRLAMSAWGFGRPLRVIQSEERAQFGQDERMSLVRGTILVQQLQRLNKGAHRVWGTNTPPVHLFFKSIRSRGGAE